MPLLPRKHVPLLATAAVLIALVTGAALTFDGFLSMFVLADLFSENAFLGITALGLTLVILSGGIDLSVGSVIGFSTIFTATMITECHLHPLLTWSLVLVIGTGFGAVMGVLIQVYKLPPFLTTLAGLFFARGLAFAVKSESVQIEHPLYDWLGQVNLPIGGGAELTFPALVFLGLFVFVLVLAHLTPFGRNIYAIGGNEDSAVLMGLPVARTKIAIYTFNGFCSALAGIAMTLYMNSGNPINAMALELDAIAVVVIGGTLLSGGIGFVAGTMLGFLIYTTLYQITYFANLPASLTTLCIGSLLLCFIVMQKLLSRDGA